MTFCDYDTLKIQDGNSCYFCANFPSFVGPSATAEGEEHAASGDNFPQVGLLLHRDGLPLARLPIQSHDVDGRHSLPGDAQAVGEVNTLDFQTAIRIDCDALRPVGGGPAGQRC